MVLPFWVEMSTVWQWPLAVSRMGHSGPARLPECSHGLDVREKAGWAWQNPSKTSTGGQRWRKHLYISPLLPGSPAAARCRLAFALGSCRGLRGAQGSPGNPPHQGHGFWRILPRRGNPSRCRPKLAASPRRLIDSLDRNGLQRPLLLLILPALRGFFCTGVFAARTHFRVRWLRTA